MIFLRILEVPSIGFGTCHRSWHVSIQFCASPTLLLHATSMVLAVVSKRFSRQSCSFDPPNQPGRRTDHWAHSLLTPRSGEPLGTHGPVLGIGCFLGQTEGVLSRTVPRRWDDHVMTDWLHTDTCSEAANHGVFFPLARPMVQWLMCHVPKKHVEYNCY